ncbi:pyridoxamine 5'-phosphate oxidase family protein [Prauserella cavernicola]|uniref:PPOX class F420-dependent oxidoreductase n=1 Tax=Prauserella cavernicola TaxID=2800127 RepID=A0A934QQ54_9PSEU|nr:PPOX class F420-dependent oxidoreductase [Prauserella cavernicola]MBK1783374.1 PPOX class F420-dependent oxidoreductase [Prauserella cavernicola]
MGTNQRAQVTMTAEEVDDFLRRSRTATLATVGPGGVPHLVAMWYGYRDGALYLETKTKSQKAVNLRRTPTAVVLVEAGQTYDQLRGVSIEAKATVIDDPGADEYWQAAIDVYERYTAPYDESARPVVEAMMHKRVVVRLDPARTRSWDHRKLGLPALPLGGSTAVGEP